VNGNSFTIKKGNLNNGIYFYEIITEEKSVPVFKGKIIIAD
jgi:hypothetical protein